MTGAGIAYALFEGPVSGLWPMLLVPALCYRLAERAARALPPTSSDWRIAAAIAAAPGVTMAGLVLMSLWRGVSRAELRWASFSVEYHAPMAVAAAILLYALWKASMRRRELRRLIGLSVSPCRRLARAAKETGLAVRRLPLPEPECFAAGFVRPVVFVSTGAIDRIDDAQLRALLRHEQAHVEAFDPAMFNALAFLADLCPGPRTAFEAYRSARERRADAAAAAAVGPVALASALLRLSRAGAPEPRPVPLGPSALGSVAWRVKAILSEEVPRPGAIQPGAAAAFPGLGLFALWPGVHLGFVYLFCPA